MIEPRVSTVQLRRTFTPYVGFFYINVAFTLLAICAAYKVKDWSLLYVPLLGYALWGIYVFLATRYRVCWDKTGVTMYADWGKRTIGYEEISTVRYETASLADGKYLTRPFRRIVIHGHRHDPKAFVDISLRHFDPKDISALLLEINRRRPELAIPWQPVRKYLSDDSI
jgi:hypothetical protein